MACVSTATGCPPRPVIDSRRSDCAPQRMAVWTGHSDSRMGRPCSSESPSMAGCQRWPRTPEAPTPVRRSAPRFHETTRQAASINTTASYILSNSRPWNSASTAGSAGGNTLLFNSQPECDAVGSSSRSQRWAVSHCIAMGSPWRNPSKSATNSGSNCVPEHSYNSVIARSCDTGRAVDVIRGHRVERFNDGDHPRTQRNMGHFGPGRGGDLRCCRPMRIVPFFCSAVVPGWHVFHDLQNLFRGATAAQDFQTHLATRSHRRRFVIVQRRRFQQNAVRRADHADVVQQRRNLDGIALGPRANPVWLPKPNKSEPPGGHDLPRPHSCIAGPRKGWPPSQAEPGRVGRRSCR